MPRLIVHQTGSTGKQMPGFRLLDELTATSYPTPQFTTPQHRIGKAEAIRPQPAGRLTGLKMCDIETEHAPVDLPRIEKAVREILAAVGEDPDREGLLDTPGRVARMYAELFSGLHQEPGRHLKRVFDETYDEMVLVRDISFNSMCEHHLLPFMGVAHVGYVPNGKVAGLSKLARVVEEISKRPQVQERMTEHIADLMEGELNAKGVVVVLEASHSCMTIRGVRKPGSLTVTSAVRGLFRTNESSRTEALALINGRQSNLII